MLRGALLLCVVCAMGLSSSRAQDLPPVSANARSIEITQDGAFATTLPSSRGERRGTLALGAFLPFVGRVSGDGCSTGIWFRLNATAYVCSASARLSAHQPTAASEPVLRAGELLPMEYAFVRDDGTRGYARPSDMDADEYIEAYGEGFGLAIVGHTRHAGERFARTQKGIYVPEDSLHYVRGSEFAGVAISGGDLRVAWVIRERIQLYDRPRGRPVRRAARHDALVLAADASGNTLALEDGTYVSARDVARPLRSPRPEGVAPDARWIDVNVSTQTLVAYEGDVPVFATLVSTGRRGRETQTPLGLHAIWAKLATSDMDDLEREDVERNYAMQSVPWVQYFQGSNGLHAAFWHNRFGERHSHGCVNLSPRDARTLFDWTRPVLPPGWTAILPQASDAPTWVRVLER